MIILIKLMMIGLQHMMMPMGLGGWNSNKNCVVCYGEIKTL